MRNEERQRKLDEDKWLWSEDVGVDASGHLQYCEACEHRADGGGCLASQDERVAKTLCAKAFNRMTNKRRKGKKS